jgi:hypothetical protein
MNECLRVQTASSNDEPSSNSLLCRLRLDCAVLLTLHDNAWAPGSSLELLCDYVDVRRTSNPAYVQFLSLDCSSELSCPCCTQC